MRRAIDLLTKQAAAQPTLVEQGLAAFQQRHDELNAAIDGLKQRIEADDRPERHDRALAELSRRHDESRRSIEQLQNQLQTADAEQRNGIKSQLDELTAAIDDLKARLHTVEAEARAPRHDEALSGLNSRHDDLNAAVGRLAARLQEIETEARAPRHDAALSSLSSRHEELTAAVDDLKAQVRKIQAEATTTPTDDARPDPTPRLDALSREIDDLKGRFEAEDRPGGADQLERVLGRQDELSAAILELKAQVEAAGAGAQPPPSVQEFAMVRTRGDEAMREIDLLKMRLNRAENQSTRSTMQASALKEQNDLLTGRHEQTLRAIEDLKAQLQAAQEDFAAFKEQAQDDRDDARRREPATAAPFANMASMASMEGPAAFAFPGRPRNGGR